MKCGFFFEEGSEASLAPFPISGNEIRFENMSAMPIPPILFIVKL